jgi:uncharacterized protein YegP (UPF0339 family)
MEFLIESHDDGGYVWRALDELGAEIVTSQRLASRQACKRAILVFKVEASCAAVYDLTEARSLPAAAAAPAPTVTPLRPRRTSNLRLIAGRGRDGGAALPAQRRSASSRQRP